MVDSRGRLSIGWCCHNNVGYLQSRYMHIDLIAPDIYILNPRRYEAMCAAYAREVDTLFSHLNPPGAQTCSALLLTTMPSVICVDSTCLCQGRFN